MQPMIRKVTLLLACVCAYDLSADQDLVKASSADSLMEAGHYKRARALVAARLHANPKDSYALFLESKIKQSFGDFPGAIASAERAVALEPHNANYHAQLAEVYAFSADQASWLRGINLVHLMKREIAASLAIAPKHTDTLLVSMMFCLRAPKFVGGDKRKARVIAGEIVQSDPNWGYLAEARVLENSGDDAHLENLLKQAVEINPTHYRALYELARFYCCVAIHKNLAAAETTSRQAMQIDPGRAGAFDLIARAYASARRWTDLDAILGQSEKAIPDDLAPFYQAANILIQDGGDRARATAYLHKYLSQEPEGREPTRAQAQSLLNLVSATK
jgi:tetratricopeptide (TPR) repeat protein